MRAKLLACLAMAAALANCGHANDDAVRHLVIAELIQREAVPETRVQIVTVHFDNEQHATVQARILDATKGGEPLKTLLCKVEKKGGRWLIASVNLR